MLIECVFIFQVVYYIYSPLLDIHFFLFFLDRLLTKGQNALVELQTQRPVALELYKDFKELGRFMLRYSGSTVAAGVVTEVL